MTNPFDDDSANYIVLVNAEQQYSLWPEWLTIPLGWVRTGPSGQRQICLDWIERTWTDMRPKHLADAMRADNP